jgi:hypothetical protein
MLSHGHSPTPSYAIRASKVQGFPRLSRVAFKPEGAAETGIQPHLAVLSPLNF